MGAIDLINSKPPKKHREVEIKTKLSFDFAFAEKQVIF
jgi:hypothetical protein